MNYQKKLLKDAAGYDEGVRRQSFERAKVAPDQKVVHNQNANRRPHLPELESVNRISNLPIVETGLNLAEKLYARVKQSNVLLYWTLNQAESSLYNAIDTASPAVYLFQGPINAIDKIVCRSLDIVEERVPQIHLPPQMIYFNTKQYVSDVSTKIVKPVLKRADSVKQIGNSVLASKYTAFAADKLDGALDVADKYVDKYLPADAFDNQGNDETAAKPIEGPAKKALQTIIHVDRFSRKLQRRLTRRTLAEAKALKEQGAEAIHVLIYVAELIATDPKLALQKGRELWETLSKDEPENQARPETLEQLIVMLTRESARRIVHFVNFTSVGVSNLPNHLSYSITYITSKCINILDTLLKTIHLDGVRVHLDGVRETLTATAKIRTQKLTNMLKLLNTYTTDILEHLAHILAGQQQASLNEINQGQSKVQTPTTTTTTTTVNQNYQTQMNAVGSLHPPSSTRVQLKASRQNTNNRVLTNGVETST